MVQAIVKESILGRSEEKGIVKFYVKNLFEYADPPHFRIDDYPFGGGSGMILKPEPIFRAYDEICKKLDNKTKTRVVFPTPDGSCFDHKKASELSVCDNLIFINGHYKGIDQRIRDNIVTDEISIGDYVLTGGELPALIILDATIRLIPGVLNNFESAQTDSFVEYLLDCPYYTRPENFREILTPKVLSSGDHEKIKDWKQKQRENKTQDRRPDLWEKYKSIA